MKCFCAVTATVALLAIPASASAMNRSKAISETINRLQENALNKWQHECQVLDYETTAIDTGVNERDKPQWKIYIVCDAAPSYAGNESGLWQQYRVYDPYGKVLASTLSQYEV
jgi:hypothetical protein